MTMDPQNKRLNPKKETYEPKQAITKMITHKEERIFFLEFVLFFSETAMHVDNNAALSIHDKLLQKRSIWDQRLNPSIF